MEKKVSIMEFKDWLLFIIQIISNGLVIFILQKIFERKQIKRDIEKEYSSTRQKVDSALELHTNATRLANEDQDKNAQIIIETIQNFFNVCLSINYYYVQNKNIFLCLKRNVKNLQRCLRSYPKV